MSSGTDVLRTPRGLAGLVALTLVGALALAVVMATNRPFFVSFVRERPRSPDAALSAFIARARRGEAHDEEGLAIARSAQDALYEAFLQGDPHDHHDDAGDAHLARLIVDAEPEHAAARIERTLVAGTGLQRLRAAELARMAPAEALTPVLQRGLERARRVGTPRLVSALERAL